jgi:resuscitation-promoting factor RpfB
METSVFRISRTTRLTLRMIFLAIFTIALYGCTAPQVSQANTQIRIPVTVDGATVEMSVASGSTVESVLKLNGIVLGNLDRVEPTLYTSLNDGDAIKVTRIREEFETVQETIPFERQTVRTELLPDGKTLISQPGENGSREITYRRLFEDNLETGDPTVVKTVVLIQPVPEIMLVGAQSPFSPLQIPGKLVYISGGNAWIMEGSTSNRQPVITSGDLDGRVFSVSPNGDWLLFTRKSTKPADEEINTLWVVNLNEAQPQPINLKVSNIVHFGSFVPWLSQTIAYSTVEPRATAPGWQANNDLAFRKFSASGAVGQPAVIIEPNSGGVYGWWGTTYSFSPNGKGLAYSRPDGIGLVDITENTLNPLLDNVPLQTGSDWTLIPGLAWGADGNSLFTVTHAPPSGLVKPEESPYFDLSALSLANSTNVQMVEQSGMFAYPAASSSRLNGDENTYKVAYLQAIFPDQSDSSRYKLVVMDRDGSNRNVLFPPEGSAGLAPQSPIWAPAPLEEGQGDYLALVYQGNLWLIDEETGRSHQVTGDGLVSKIDWK